MARRGINIMTFEGLKDQPRYGAVASPPMSQAAKDLWNALMDQSFNWDVSGATVTWTPALPMTVRPDLREEIESAILGGWGLYGNDLMQVTVKGGGAVTRLGPFAITGTPGKPFPWGLWLGIGAFAALVLYPWKKKGGS